MKKVFKSRLRNIVFLLVTLFFVCTSVGVGLYFSKNDQNLAQLAKMTSANDQPDNPDIYWIDSEAQTELGVDFSSYSLFGSGTPADPYLIQSENDLAFLSWTTYTGNAYNGHVSGSFYYSEIYFKQTQNLDMSAYMWQPIGVYYNRGGLIVNRYFSGNYDGGGFVISGLFTPSGTGNAYSYQGLFGYVSSPSSGQRAMISNIGVIDSLIQGYSDVAGIVGHSNSYINLINVYNTGNVSASGNNVGGIVGYSNFAAFRNCYNRGNIVGDGNYVGGIVGYLGTTLSNIYNTGSVSGSQYVGGIAGYGSPKSCFNIGSVTGTQYVGGIAGARMTESNIVNAYYGGDCTLTVGVASGGGDATRIDSSLEEWAKNEDWYVFNRTFEDGTFVWDLDYTWDFDDIWYIDPLQNEGFPILNIIDENSLYYWTDEYVQSKLDVDFANYSLSGTGTETDPYLVQSEIDLAFLSWTTYTGNAYNGHVSGNNYYSDIYFKQTKNLDMSAYIWRPIGYYANSVYHYFSGNYDGDGFVISGLFTGIATSILSDYQGLFGRISGSSSKYSVIANLGIIDSFIKGSDSVGGVVGDGSYVDLINVYYSGEIIGTGGCTGGIVGYINGNIANCYNLGDIAGTTDISNSGQIGGVVGNCTYDTTISDCYNLGSVTGEGYYIGGIVGEGSTITNCYNSGNISGTGNYLGGISGRSNTITNCYNTGNISGNCCGGISGTGNVTNSYNNGIIMGDTSVGGVVGNGSAANAYNTGNVSGSSQVGGVVGNGSASNSYNTGSVTGVTDVGGVIGVVTRNTITNLYNKGIVIGNSSVGGVVGSASATRIINVFNTGSVNGESVIGGILGEASTAGVLNSYYGGDCTLTLGIGSGESGGSFIDLPVENWAKSVDWFSFDPTVESGSFVWHPGYIWDFNTIWYIQSDQNDGYPMLYKNGEGNQSSYDKWIDENVQAELEVDFDNYSLSGSGLVSDPYLIQSETDLAFLSWTICSDQVYGGETNKINLNGFVYYYSNIYFKQTCSLDMSAYYWQPIGTFVTIENVSTPLAFAGHYDGGGYTILGLSTIPGSGEEYSYQGLFGLMLGLSETDMATLSNVNLVDSFIQGEQGVGLVGIAMYASITNVSNSGIVVGTGSVSGIVGIAQMVTITDSYNNAMVTSRENRCGGIVGEGYALTLMNAHNSGNIISGSYTGGIVGSASESTINTAYNVGYVMGSENVGGIVGYSSSSLTINNTYNAGNVTGIDVYVGGIVGYSSSSLTISNSGVEASNITGLNQTGILVGNLSSSSSSIENCFAIMEDDLAPIGRNYGTLNNCLWIVGDTKYYVGTDFSAFAWFNLDSCPVPKEMSWIGQYWTEDITTQILSSSDWTEWVEA